MDSTLSASLATCRVSRKQGLAPRLPWSPPPIALLSWGSGPSMPRLGSLGRRLPLGCPQSPRLGKGEAAATLIMVPKVSWPGAHRPSAVSHFHIQRPAQARQRVRGRSWICPVLCLCPTPGCLGKAGWVWMRGHVLIVLSPWVTEEGHPCRVDQEPESFLRKAGPPKSPSCLGPCHCLLPGERVWPWLAAAALPISPVTGWAGLCQPLSAPCSPRPLAHTCPLLAPHPSSYHPMPCPPNL